MLHGTQQLHLNEAQLYYLVRTGGSKFWSKLLQRMFTIEE